MNDLLQALITADDVCKEANPYYEKGVQLEQEAESMAEQFKKTKTKWIVIGFAIWWGASFIGSAVGTILRILPFIGDFLTLAASGISGIAGIVLGYKIASDKYKEEKVALETQIADKKKQGEASKNQSLKILKDHAEELEFLPVDYWYPMATDYLVKLVKTGRADTLADALNKFDEQLHRWKVEEANAQSIVQQQQQTAHLASIKTSSKVSAAANVANTVFNIASRM